MKNNEGTDIIKEGLNELLSKEKPNLPYYMEDTFKTCLTLGLLFEGLKLGEIANNVVFQLSRLFQSFGSKVEFDKEEIKEIVQHFVEIIQKKLKKLGEQDGKISEVNEKESIDKNK